MVWGQLQRGQGGGDVGKGLFLAGCNVPLDAVHTPVVNVSGGVVSVYQIARIRVLTDPAWPVQSVT